MGGRGGLGSPGSYIYTAADRIIEKNDRKIRQLTEKRKKRSDALTCFSIIMVFACLCYKFVL